MQFILIISKAKRCTCHPKGPISGGWSRHRPASPLRRSCWLLWAQPAPLLSLSSLHPRTRAAPELTRRHQCCCCTSAGVPSPWTSSARGERVPAPGCLPQAPSHPDGVVEPAACGQLWQARESVWLFGSHLLFKYLFSKKDAELSSNIVHDACGKGFLNQGTASKLQLSKHPSLFKDSGTSSSSLWTLW